MTLNSCFTLNHGWLFPVMLLAGGQISLLTDITNMTYDIAAINRSCSS